MSSELMNPIRCELKRTKIKKKRNVYRMCRIKMKFKHLPLLPLFLNLSHSMWLINFENSRISTTTKTNTNNSIIIELDYNYNPI